MTTPIDAPTTPVRGQPSWRLVLAVARLEMTSYTRSLGGFLFAVLAPTVIFLVAANFWYPREYLAAAVPDVAGLSVLSTGLFSIGVAITEQRKEGTLKTYLASPLSKGIYLAGQILDRLVVLFAGNVVMMLVAGFGYDVWPRGSALVIVPVFLLVIATMLALGFALSSRFRSVETAGATTAILFGGAMLAAGYFPLEGRVPDLVLTVLEYLPFWPMAGALRSAWFGVHDGLAVHLLVLGAWLAVFVVVAMRFFRWTPDDR